MPRKRPPGKTPYARVQRLQTRMREKGVAGLWVPGTYLGPGRSEGEAHMSFIWGPDGFALSVAKPDARAQMGLLHKSGARRPVIVQTMTANKVSREIIRLELSDFLDLLAVYTNWLAQEGRLGQDE